MEHMSVEHEGNIVRIHRPQLDPMEQERRMENIRRAAAALVLAARGTQADREGAS